MKKRYLFLALIPILVFLFSPYIFPAKEDPFTPLPTQFIYPEKKLNHSSSKHLMTLESINKWEKPLQDYLNANHVFYPTQLRFYTYLYLAQRDATFLSYNIHRCFIGSLDPLTKKIVLSFFPDFTDFPQLETDSYSEELAHVVWQPYQKRLEKEEANHNRFPSCFDKPVSPLVQAMAKWIPWITPLPQVPPPTENLQEQIKMLEKSRENLSDEQIKLAYCWSDEKEMTCYWWLIMNHFLQEHQIPLGKTLFVRSMVMIALYDALYACFDAKYHYCVPRPYQVDPSLHIFVSKPLSPSYPDGYSTQGYAASLVLALFFPDEKSKFQNIAKESSNSRLWAGTNTPQDLKAGQQLGEEIGEKIVELIRNQTLSQPNAK